MKSTNAIYDIMNGYTADPEYDERMMHRIPDAKSVSRVQHILKKCEGKTVLHVGCTGKLHAKIEQVAKVAWGLDKDDLECKNFIKMDLATESITTIEKLDYDFVILGEVLEHLCNPGELIRDCASLGWPLLISVPNAFCSVGLKWVLKGVENVHKEHVSYYSYWTLHQLVTRYGYKVKEFHWCKGLPFIAEGLMFYCEA